MTKKERVLAAIEGREPDGVPSGFSLHFPLEERLGESTVKAHLNYFHESDCDILKIMNEYRLPVNGVIRTPDEYEQAIPQDYRKAGFLHNQIETAKRIRDLADPDAFTLGTLHGICSYGFQPFMKMGYGFEVGESRQVQADFLRWNEKKMLSVMERICEGLCDMAKAYVQEAGVDGVYYSVIGADRKWFTDEEFARWIRPFDLRIMKAIKDAGGYCFLHVCNPNLNMDRIDPAYTELSDAINWGVYDAPMTLEAGRRKFGKKAIFGGLANRSGVLVDGTEEQVRAEVKRIITSFGRTSFILGADCTLATEQNLSLVRAAVEQARSM